jgi:hypothetical protein
VAVTARGLGALVLGTLVGLSVSLGLGACSECGRDNELGDFTFARSVPFEYDFEGERAPFHEDEPLGDGQMRAITADDVVTIRYPTRAGDKLEVWAITRFQRRDNR